MWNLITTRVAFLQSCSTAEADVNIVMEFLDIHGERACTSKKTKNDSMERAGMSQPGRIYLLLSHTRLELQNNTH